MGVIHEVGLVINSKQTRASVNTQVSICILTYPWGQQDFICQVFTPHKVGFLDIGENASEIIEWSRKLIQD